MADENLQTTTTVPGSQTTAAPVVDTTNVTTEVKTPDAPLTLDPVVTDVTTDAYTYEATGDAALDIALEFLGKAGFGIDHPAVIAAQEKGDFSLLEAFLKEKKVPGWEKHLAIGKEAYQRASQVAEARKVETQTIVHDTVGGADAWKEIQAWAASNADDAERVQVNQAFAQGGLMAKAMASFLSNEYRNASGVTVKPASPIKENVRPNEPATNGPMSRMQYADGVQDLRQKFGPGFESRAEYKALQQRYLATKR